MLASSGQTFPAQILAIQEIIHKNLNLMIKNYLEILFAWDFTQCISYRTRVHTVVSGSVHVGDSSSSTASWRDRLVSSLLVSLTSSSQVRWYTEGHCRAADSCTGEFTSLMRGVFTSSSSLDTGDSYRWLCRFSTLPAGVMVTAGVLTGGLRRPSSVDATLLSVELDECLLICNKHTV